MKCKETSGILFNHPCDKTAETSCTLCNRPICERHMRHHQDKPACINCVRERIKEERQSGQAASGGSYRDDPYFFFYYGGYGSDDPYDDDDFALFEGGDGAEAYAMDDDGAWVGS